MPATSDPTGYPGGALVGGQLDEELVAAQQVGQVRPGGQVMPSPTGLVPAGRVVAALRGHDLSAELIEQVVIRVRAAVPFLRPESRQHP
jgi:hypothetical protein